MHAVHPRFLNAPFHRSDALAAGVTRGVLQGTRFRRLHENVYCASQLSLTFLHELEAARLALPQHARTTGITRLQELGLDFGPREPLHFVVEGDHHLVLDGIFVHRTVKLPPSGQLGVSVEAAYVAYCAAARTINAVKVGCELLRREWLDLDLLDQILVEERWRRGVVETRWVLPYLDDRCRSLPEAELLTLLRFAGLPDPAVNESMVLPGNIVLTPDFWYAPWHRAVEYEGSQHQTDRGQYNADIDRYAVYRRHGVDYVLITKEVLTLPRTAVRRVHQLLVEGGYDGPAPDFGSPWQSLFVPLRDVVRLRTPRRR